MVCDPVHLLEMVMPCFGGGAVVVTNAERAKSAKHRPVFLSGYGEFVSHKTVTYMKDITVTPAKPAAATCRRSTLPGCPTGGPGLSTPGAPIFVIEPDLALAPGPHML